MTHIIIPQQYQAVPKKTHGYTQHQVGNTLLYKPSGSDTDLRSGLEVATSKIHGSGLFAKRYIPKDTVIWKENLIKNFASPEQDGPLRWTNHSDDPNSELVVSLDEILQIGLIARQDIKEHDEITYNYNQFGHTGYQSLCTCSKPNCPGSFALRTEWGERQ